MNPNQTQLDPQAMNLAKSIRRAETGSSTDPYNAKGASGETGAYQYMPETWKAWSKEFLGDENAPLSVENQNKVAYSRIKKWKDEGYNPSQIASMWNSGEPDVYLRNDSRAKDVNDQGVSYDVPAYVAKVSQYYREVSGSGATPAPGAPSGIGPVNVPQAGGVAPASVQQPPAPAEVPQQPEAEDTRSMSRKIADFTGMGKTADTLGALIARTKIGAKLTGGDYEANREYIEAPTGKEVAGAALNVGALALGGAGTAIAGTKLAGGKLLSALGTGVKAGALSGGAAGMASGLENNDTAGATLGKTAIGAGIGAGLGLLTPGASATSGLVPATLRAGKSTVRKVVEGAEEAVAKQAMVRSLPKVEQEVVRSGLPENVLNLSKTTPRTQKSFSEMMAMHKRGLADREYARGNMVKQVPARSFLEVVDGIKKQSNIAAGNLKAIAAKNPNERIDFSPAFQKYIDSLRSKGVQLNPKTGQFVSDGRIPASEMKYYNDILGEIQAVVKDNPQLTRQQAHVLRQRLFATLDSATRQGGKPGQRPFSSDVDNDVQVFRKEIARLLGKEYQDAAATYAQNEKVLSEVAKAAGTTIDKVSAKDRKLGEVFMRVLGNASDRPQTLIDDVVKAAERNGVKNDVDINAQIEFADLLEKLYGSTQSRTMASQVRQGVREANEDILPDIATGNITGAIMRGGRNLIGKGEDDQIRALEAYINEMNKNKGLIDK